MKILINQKKTQENIYSLVQKEVDENPNAISYNI